MNFKTLRDWRFLLDDVTYNKTRKQLNLDFLLCNYSMMCIFSRNAQK